MSDEEGDLFPLMRRCSVPESAIGRMIVRLLLDHSHAKADTPEVIAVLQGLQRLDLSSQGAQFLRRFASYARRHWILENAVILPIALLRLGSSDLDSLRHWMMPRRGLQTGTVDDD